MGESTCLLSQATPSVVICFGGHSKLIHPPTCTLSCRGPHSFHDEQIHREVGDCQGPTADWCQLGVVWVSHLVSPFLLFLSLRPGGCPPCIRPPQAPHYAKTKTQAPGHRIPGDAPEHGLDGEPGAPALGCPLSNLLVLSLRPGAVPSTRVFIDALIHGCRVALHRSANSGVNF